MRNIAWRLGEAMRRRLNGALSLMLVLATLGLGASPASAATLPLTVSVVGTGSNNQYDPEIGGRLVAWTDRNLTAGQDSDIRLYDRVQQSSMIVSGVDSTYQYSPDVSLDRVVWEDGGATRGVRVFDARTSSTSQVAAGLADSAIRPRIDGDIVVWEDVSANRLRYAWSHGTALTVPGADNVVRYDVDNGLIVWDEALVTEQIRMYRVGMPGVDQLLYNVPASKDVTSLEVHGSRVAITMEDTGDGVRDAVVINAQSGQLSYIAVGAPGNDCYDPVVFDHDSAWVGDPSSDLDVWMHAAGYDEQLACGESMDEQAPSLFGHAIAYQYSVTAIDRDIYVKSGAVEAHRTSGTSRYDTAVAASKQYFVAADKAVLCSGVNFPDALCAAPLARLYGGPLLLTAPDHLTPVTKAELQRLGVDLVQIVGGPAAVSDTVADELEAAGFAVQRLSGNNRFETSAAVADKIYANTSLTDGKRTLFIARGDTFPDALAVGPVAAASLSPVVLVQPTAVPPASGMVIVDWLPSTVIVVGSENAVSASVYNQLSEDAFGATFTRVAGANRYETAIAVFEKGLEKRWVDLDTVGIAVGTNFPDALGGGAALGCYGSPLLLVQRTSVPGSVSACLADHRLEVGRVDVFGGPDVVSDGVKSAVASAVH